MSKLINDFTCHVCGNTDSHSIGMINGKPYCRRCIAFKGEEAGFSHSLPKAAPIFFLMTCPVNKKNYRIDWLAIMTTELIVWFMQFVDHQRHEKHNKKGGKYE